MKNIVLIIFSTALFSSCATISYEIEGNIQYVNINTNEPGIVIYEGDTLLTSKNKVFIRTERKKESLNIKILNDTLEKPVTINSKNSLEYWLNIPTNYGIGMLIDKNSTNRYAYPKNVYIDVSNSKNEYYLSDRTNSTSDLSLHLSIPYVNQFYFQPNNIESKTNTGFWGISTGLDYYYKTNKFLSFKGLLATDFFVPVPAPVTLDDTRENMNTTNLELTDNYKSGKFRLGYGINYSWNNWKFIDTTQPDNRIEINRRSQNIGLTTNIYYQIGRAFNIGIIYRPTFYRVTPIAQFNYEHLFSLDLAWKIRLKD